jgi:hypothetical protein
MHVLAYYKYDSYKAYVIVICAPLLSVGSSDSCSSSVYVHRPSHSVQEYPGSSSSHERPLVTFGQIIILRKLVASLPLDRRPVFIHLFSHPHVVIYAEVVLLNLLPVCAPSVHKD